MRRLAVALDFDLQSDSSGSRQTSGGPEFWRISYELIWAKRTARADQRLMTAIAITRDFGDISTSFRRAGFPGARSCSLAD